MKIVNNYSSIKYLLLIFFFMDISGEIERTQSYQDIKPLPSLSLSTVRENPDLGVDFDKNIQLKLASRKLQYHLNELISLDLALSSTNEDNIYAMISAFPQFTCKTALGKNIGILPYIIVREAITPNSFFLLKKNEFLAETSLLLAGCDSRAFRKDRDIEEDIVAFRKNHFVSFGSACINITRPGKYIIQAEISNGYVVINPEKKDIKTAVGAIKSTPLTITITK